MAVRAKTPSSSRTITTASSITKAVRLNPCRASTAKAASSTSGTFSRTIFAALRIGYLVVPKSLTPAFTAAKWLNDLHSATLEQQTLAEFISSGMYERHLPRLRRRNAARRKAMMEAIGRYLGNRVTVTGDGSGAHVVLWPVKPISEAAITAKAAERGVGVRGIAHCYLAQPAATGLILGYSRLNEQEIREGIRRLAEVL